MSSVWLLPAILPSYVWERSRQLMRINPDTMKSVVFIGVESERGFTPLGTGFIMVFEFDPDFAFTFVVTAAHLIENLSDAARKNIVVRVNRQGGGAVPIQPDLARVFTHQQRANDIMLIAVRLDPAVHDVIAMSGNRAILEKQRADADADLMPGDTVSAIGLYTSHHGLEKNRPVLRTGTLAALADEPLYTKRGYAKAYLIELRTFAGLSGSPVYQMNQPVRIKGGQLEHRNEDMTHGIPLGVLVGYHCVEDKDDIISVPRFGPQESGASGEEYSADERNTGFGVVIPIERTFEIFERDDVQEGFRNAIELFKATSPQYREANKPASD